MEQVLAFERTKDPDGQFIPLVVRMKLDLAGVRIHLADWQALSNKERQTLVRVPVADPTARDHFVATLQQMLTAAGRSKIEQKVAATAKTLACLDDSEPGCVTAICAHAGVVADWGNLGCFERYLLCHAAAKNDRALCRTIASEMPALQLAPVRGG